MIAPAQMETYPVLPGSVYVWRGFKSPARTYDQFAQFLGSVFVPACVLLQPPVGLRAYLPTMVPQDRRPAAVPDQTALMFWATPDAHHLAHHAIAVRIYQNLRGAAYDLARSHTTEVPVAIATANGRLVAEQPYFLLNRTADWMLGEVDHLVGARRSDLPATEFLARACAWAVLFHASPPDEIDGALVCCGNDYLVAWVHGPRHGRALSSALNDLAMLTVPVLRASPRAMSLPAGLWNDWSGFDLTRDTCINIQFARARTAAPLPLTPDGR